MTPTEALANLNKKIKYEWRMAFLAAFCIGLLVHLPVMLADIPNHDGLDSLYFDQNMITSGRWFLMVACGFSSFYSVPWVIGLLGLCFLGVAAAMLTELLDVRKTWAIIAVSGLLVTFPALASTFAYVFTLDGYMLALLLAVLAVFLTRKMPFGFLMGGVSLAFSMGIYQAYLPFAMILSIFVLLQEYIEPGEIKTKAKDTLRYVGMGVLGAVLYYVILKILLLMQGKELASYQGINDMASANTGKGIAGTLINIYRDFAAFTVKGNVLWNNAVSAGLVCLLSIAFGITAIQLLCRRKLWKNAWTYLVMLAVLVVLPFAANVILIISPSVTYHLLMRYQWVLLLMGMTTFVARYSEEISENNGKSSLAAKIGEWLAFAAVLALVFFYGVTDNVAYTNLSKKYEKTYAYCVRLLDRIEQTEGYYPGIPVAMIGVVGDEQFPSTDYTLPVTSDMIGMYGDYLLYTGPNYQKFIQNYLGATLNMLPAEAMAEMYYDEEYVAMDSFPGENSVRIIDGIMYIKTENTTRE